MAKFYVNGTIVPKEEENFVRPVKEGRNITLRTPDLHSIDIPPLFIQLAYFFLP